MYKRLQCIQLIWSENLTFFKKKKKINTRNTDNLYQQGIVLILREPSLMKQFCALINSSIFFSFSKQTDQILLNIMKSIRIEAVKCVLIGNCLAYNHFDMQGSTRQGQRQKSTSSTKSTKPHCVLIFDSQDKLTITKNKHQNTNVWFRSKMLHSQLYLQKHLFFLSLFSNSTNIQLSFIYQKKKKRVFHLRGSNKLQQVQALAHPEPLKVGYEASCTSVQLQPQSSDLYTLQGKLLQHHLLCSHILNTLLQYFMTHSIHDKGQKYIIRTHDKSLHYRTALYHSSQK